MLGSAAGRPHVGTGEGWEMGEEKLGDLRDEFAQRAVPPSQRGAEMPSPIGEGRAFIFLIFETRLSV